MRYCHRPLQTPVSDRNQPKRSCHSGTAGWGNAAEQADLDGSMAAGALDVGAEVEADFTWGTALAESSLVCSPAPLEHTPEDGVEQATSNASGARALWSMLAPPSREAAGPTADTMSSDYRSKPQAREAGQAAVEAAEAQLRDHRADLAERAAAGDREARETMQTKAALEDAHRSFSEVDLGNGTTVPAPYMVNYSSKTWTDRKRSDARKGARSAMRAQDADMGRAAVGKASAEANQEMLQALLAERPWERLPADEARVFRTKLARVLPEGAKGATRAAYEVLVYAQLAGLGTDCAGYMQHVLTSAGVMRDPGVMTGVGGLTRSWGDGVDGTSHKGRGKSSVARPVDANGTVVVRAGDMMRMSGGGHIGLVLDVVDNGDQVLLRVSHSTPDQAVHGVGGRMGTKTEGIREDLIAWSRTEQRWTAIRAFRSSAQLNKKGTISGFFRHSSAKLDEKRPAK